MPQQQLKVMISSTALDLPEHRQLAIVACRRQGASALVMEDLPARDADAIRVSLEMVDKADVYLCIFAWRYGHLPEQHDISITEMEFNRALERGIPILVFLIHKSHTITIEMVEREGMAAKKLEDLKARACKNRVRVEFKSPEDLRGLIVDALGAFVKEKAGEKNALSNLHPPNLIPAAPAPYLAHPYSLLQTHEVVGRRAELSLLTDWITTNKQVPTDVRLLNVVAIGGMGKSAVTWKWFSDIAPNELPHLAGRMWWSFYESDAYFENFVIRALAYAAGLPEAEIRQMPVQDREDQLWQLLDQRPFLLVLDGLERILLAYSRMDAAHLPDNDLDQQTANVLAEIYGLPDDVKETYLEKHRLRQCADPRAGQFLRRLAQVNASRVLVSTRLYPAELQTNTAQPRPGSGFIALRGLSDDDALALWREFIGSERSGTSEQLLPLFRAFENYPLLLRALAGEIAEYKPAPGDFDRWRKDHPDFNPAALSLKNAKTHVLEFALRGLGEVERQVLNTIAAFRMPTTWDTLRTVLVASRDTSVSRSKLRPRTRRAREMETRARMPAPAKPCQDDRALDATLTELEDRGLVGWDRRANRYDLHPIVRGVVWNRLGDDTRRGVYTTLHAHFEALPMIDDYLKVNSLEDLTPAIELYNTLIGLRRFDDAFDVFSTRLEAATLWRLSANRQRVELLEMLFPDGVEQLPSLKANTQARVLTALAIGYELTGRPQRAVTLFRRDNKLHLERGEYHRLKTCLGNLSDALLMVGSLFQAEAAACQALLISREQHEPSKESGNLGRYGLTLATRGIADKSKRALRRSVRISVARSDSGREGIVTCDLARRALYFGEFVAALSFANRAWELVNVLKLEKEVIDAARVQGQAALELDHFTTADDRLHHALTRARMVNLVEVELLALVTLAQLRCRQKDLRGAREFLDDIWDAADRGPYPLIHADAFNVLAQIECHTGDTAAAVEAATKAYRLAWCDGPPFAYHWGLEKAKKHLKELGAPEPEMPPLDESKFEPMPEVEIDPDDEFHVGNVSDISEG